jgi:hypothetical protein
MQVFLINGKRTVIFCAVIALYFNVKAQAFDAGGIRYAIVSDTEVYVTAKTPLYSGNVVIPPTATHDTVTYTVTGIGDFAFSQCMLLTSINLPNTVRTVGVGAFSVCMSLTSIEIPQSVIEIGEVAFTGCMNLENIIVDANNPRFSSDNGILFSKLQDTLLVYPAGKTEAVYAIPDATTAIGSGAFILSSLINIQIPNSILFIGEGAFSNSLILTDIAVDATNPNYSSLDGVLFSRQQDTLITYPAGKTANSYFIPNTVAVIGMAAFGGCSGLKTLAVPASVTAMHEVLFANSGLTRINMESPTPPRIDSTTFMEMQTIRIYVPCGAAGTYRVAPHWSSLSYIIDNDPPSVTLHSNNSALGNAFLDKANSCANEEAIIKAIANQGNYFVKWNDDNTDNPRTITVTSDTIFTAVFEAGNAIAEAGQVLSVQVYPNPGNDDIRVSLPEGFANAQFVLYDLQGKALFKRSINNQDVISIANLASGVYTYRVTTETQCSIGKLIRK